MSTTQSGIQSMQRAATAALREHWVLFLVEGVVLLVLGATAVVLPPIATLAVTILLGWLFLVSGIVGIITTFWMRHAPGFWWSLLSAVLGIVVGAMLLASPLVGAFSLTLVLIAFFIIEGAASIMFALRSQTGIIRPMGLDADERHHRSGAGHDDIRRLAQHGGVGRRTCSSASI